VSLRAFASWREIGPKQSIESKKNGKKLNSFPSEIDNGHLFFHDFFVNDLIPVSYL
jgi:hypothetical protein